MIMQVQPVQDSTHSFESSPNRKYIASIVSGGVVGGVSSIVSRECLNCIINVGMVGACIMCAHEMSVVALLECGHMKWSHGFILGTDVG